MSYRPPWPFSWYKVLALEMLDIEGMLLYASLISTLSIKMTPTSAIYNPVQIAYSLGHCIIFTKRQVPPANPLFSLLVGLQVK